MGTRWRLVLVAIAWSAAHTALFAPSARADDFELKIEIKYGEEQAETNGTQEQPSPDEPPARPVFQAPRGTEIEVSWSALNAGKESFTDVLVHFFVVREDEPGQEPVPKLDENVEHEGAITMDFEPDDEADGKFTLNIADPGAYLVRIETIGLAAEHDHEHFAALDLVVEE